MRSSTLQTLALDVRERLSKASEFGLQARRSGIHRLGVFAGKTIPAKVKVIEYAGEKISRRETRRRFLQILKRRNGRLNYLAEIDSYWTIDGAVGGNGAELINHSCAPNLKSQRTHGRIWLISLRKIRRGEELAYDYTFPKDGVRSPCRCGAPNCRGTINLRCPDRYQPNLLAPVRTCATSSARNRRIPLHGRTVRPSPIVRGGFRWPPTLQPPT
jgi:uncharacterized protein